jgi:hypothetical protein
VRHSSRWIAVGPSDGFLQGEPFGKLFQIVGDTPTLAAVGASGVDQSSKTEPPIAVNPALCGAQWQRGDPGDPGKRHVLSEMSAQLPVTVEGPEALRLGEFGQHGDRGSVVRERFHAAFYAK